LASEIKTGSKPNQVTLAILFLIIVVSGVGGLISLIDPSFVYVLLPGGTDYVLGGTIYEAVYVILTLATDALYLFGGAIVAFGAILTILRFIEVKLKEPYSHRCRRVTCRVT
jgi:hypothetical protein